MSRMPRAAIESAKARKGAIASPPARESLKLGSPLPITARSPVRIPSIG